MKKTFIFVMLLALMGGAMAQHKAVNEYVSVLLTLNDTNLLPQETLAKYGVKIQTHQGRMATALVSAENYQAFLNAGLVERVQPSTRVYLTEEQTNAPVAENHAVRSDFAQHDKAFRASPERSEREPRTAPAHPHHHPEPAQAAEERDVRYHLIPEEEIYNDEARGFYLGLLLGNCHNFLYADEEASYLERGLNLDLRAGYQFNSWFGIRSGLSLMSKAYGYDFAYIFRPNADDPSTEYETSDYYYHRNTYLQLPVMADLSVGGENVRLHLMLGGYAAFALSHYSEDYINGDIFPTNAGNGFPSSDYRRWDAGLAGGLGLTLNLTPAWQFHVECDYYHSLINVVPDIRLTEIGYLSGIHGMNRTIAFATGLTYHF